MYKSKAISLLKTFTKAEIKSFGLFVRSPFFNNEKVQINFYDLLKIHYPDFDSVSIKKEKLYEKLYPAKKYNDGAMKNIISDMLRLLEEFIKIKSFKDDKFYSEYFLLKSLSSKQQKNLFSRSTLNIEKTLDESVKDSEYYYRKALIETEKRIFRIAEKDSLIKVDDNEELISDYLFISFIIQILYKNTSLINLNKNIFDHNFHLTFADELEKFLSKKNNKYKDIPYIKYFYNTFKLFQTGKENYFFELKDFLDKEPGILSKGDSETLYNTLINFSYNKFNEGNEQYMKILFALYRRRFESGLHKGERAFLRHTTFLSTVTCGLEEGEHDWIKDFINKYIDEVQKEFREDTYNMSMAIYYYWKKDYGKSLNHISKVTSDDMAFKFNTKSLYLKIYFDLNESEPFYSHIDTFKHFYSNNKLVSERYNELLGNYVYYAKKLFDMKSEPEKTDDFEVKKLIKKIQKHNYVLNKSWLLKKSAELESVIK